MKKVLLFIILFALVACSYQKEELKKTNRVTQTNRRLDQSQQSTDNLFDEMK
jgi:uncharacterized protein YcfL